jgi:NADPH:quinone reductase and related Zn-dependent oxidoreductases
MLARLIASTASNGIVAACGLAGGSDLPTTVLPFILRGVSLWGINSVFQPPEVRLDLWNRLATADLPLDEIGQTIPLAEALENAPRVLAGLTRGRVVVKVLD